MKGVDYLYVRADGRLELNIRGEITTGDGAKIALRADGVALPQKGSPIAQLRENASMLTAHENYLWVNGLQVWAPGTLDLSKGEVFVEGFAA